MLHVGRAFSTTTRAASAAAAGAAAATAARKKWFLLTYDYVPDILEKRGPVRPAHLAHADAFARKGSLVLGGALQPPRQATLVFHVHDRREVEEFVRDDPYVKSTAPQLVTAHRIDEWTVVVGSLVPKA